MFDLVNDTLIVVDMFIYNLQKFVTCPHDIQSTNFEVRLNFVEDSPGPRIKQNFGLKSKV